jgi:hypothetical protein
MTAAQQAKARLERVLFHLIVQRSEARTQTDWDYWWAPSETCARILRDWRHLC